MNYRCWKVNRPDEGEAKRLCAELGVPLLVARVLLARNITSPQQAAALLEGGGELSSPFEMKDMDKAVVRIMRAIEEGEKMVVFGDYDVDGVTATALLFTHLVNLGANVRCMLPSREGDGYGLSKKAVKKLVENGYKLIVTVDNGVSAVEELEYAYEQGLEAVITDHHLPPERLPRAEAIVDPARPDDESPFKPLAGVGVAFKLAAALEGCAPEELLEYYADLVAVGTVADVVPLLTENRTLVQAGLEMLNQQARPGLTALVEAAGLEGRTLTAENISFALAPRLNAAGRMDNATSALRLLITEEEEAADQLAQALCDMNAERQQAEQTIMEEVRGQIERDPALLADRVLVLWGENYHPGVTGIAASRLVEKYGRPTILISLSEGKGKGSGRSVKGFHLYNAIAACEPLLLRFGGHELAAGLSLEESNVQAFRRAVNEWAAQQYPVMQQPDLQADVPVRLDAVTVEDVQALGTLAPFGAANPSPLFLLEKATVEGIYPVSDGRHSRLRLRQGASGIYAAWFGQSPDTMPYPVGSEVDVVLALSVYEGKAGAQLSGRIKEIRPAGLSEDHVRQAALFEAYRAGTRLTDPEKEALRPQRADTVAVYQQVRGGGVTPADLRPLFAKLPAIRPGRILASLAALEQVGLIAAKGEGEGWYELIPTREKKDLTAAPVLRGLN